MTFTLTQEQYEALIALARRGTAGDINRLADLEIFLRSIEASNGVKRSFLWVQWQEQSSPMPVGSKFPENFPPQQRRSIELISRPIARADVQAVLDQYAKDPGSVLVTKDPAARLGWTTLDDFFVT